MPGLGTRTTAVLADPHPIRRVWGGLLVRSGAHRWLRLRRPGYELHFDRSSICRRIWRDPTFGTQEEALLASLVQPGDRAVDIGANVGTTTLALAGAVGPTGSVVAVEAHPVTATRLRRNVELNGARQVTVRQCAVASADVTEVGVSDEESDDLNHVVATGGVRVPAVTLASLLDEPTALVKIDVEGLEYDVLASGGGALQRVHAVYFEHVAIAYARYGRDLGQVIRLLTGHGFAVYRWQDDALIRIDDTHSSEHIENLVALRDGA